MVDSTIAMSTARVATERPKRYGKQLASHFSKRMDTHWDQDSGRGDLTFVGQGTESEDPRAAFDGKVHVSLVASDNVLLMHLEGPEHLMERFERVIGGHLVRFGARDELVCTWRRSNGEEGTTQVFKDEEA